MNRNTRWLLEMLDGANLLQDLCGLSAHELKDKAPRKLGLRAEFADGVQWEYLADALEVC